MFTHLKTLAAASAVALSLTGAALADGHATDNRDGWLTFIDVHQISDPAEAEAYADWIGGLAGKYGIQLVEAYDVMSIQDGSPDGQWIFMFRSPDPHTVGAWMNDPEYSAHLPLPGENTGEKPAKRIWVQPTGYLGN